MEDLTDVVSTTGGPVQGIVRGGTRQFLAIPYAAPPTGAARWTPPRPPAPWTRPLTAITHGPGCAQNATLHGFAAPSQAENCLYLNVITPARIAEPRPVLVWIHPGGLFCGSSHDYDPTALVTRGNVLAVSFTYRLNLFGFFSHPAINDERHPAGNYGILDQQLALQWVRDNIVHFGGDPGCVTLFGESAGAVSVETHLISPGSRGLFHRAIVQSSNFWSHQRPTLEQAAILGVEFAHAAGCRDSAGALRGLSSQQILTTNAPGVSGSPQMGGRFHVGLMVDGEIVPRQIRDGLGAGQFHRVPVLRGMTRTEHSWFLGLEELGSGRPLTAANYRTRLTALFGDAAADVLAEYPLDQYPSPSSALATVLTDANWITGERDCVQAMSRYVDVFAYQFDVPDTRISTPAVSFPYDSAHTADLQYLFPTFHGATGTVPPLTAAQSTLSAAMITAWASFAATGRPDLSTPSGAPWAPYTSEADTIMRLTSPASPDLFDGLAEQHHYAFWTSLRSP